MIKINKKYILFIIIFFIFGNKPFFPSNAMLLDDSQEIYPAGLYLEYLEDKNDKLTINDMERPDVSSKFIQSKAVSPNFGYTTSAYWIRLKIKDDSVKINKWLIEIAWHFLNTVRIYIPEDHHEYTVKESGNSLPFIQREILHRNIIFYLPLKNGEEKTIYIYVKTEGNVLLPITVYSFESFFKQSYTEQIWLGFLYGIISVMIIYNLFLFFFLKDRTYLYYVLTLFFWLLVQMSITGSAYQYLWTDLSWWNTKSFIFFISSCLFFTLKFSGNFLFTKKYTPVINRLLVILEIMSIAIAVLSFFIYYAIMIKIALIYVVLCLSTLIINGFFCLFKNYRPARYYLIAWTALFTGNIIMILRNFSVLPHNAITDNAVQIGPVLLVILLSIALADRINIMRRENEEAQRIAGQAETLRTAKEQEEKLNKQKTDFFVNLSHEIKTPLTLITNYLTEYLKKTKTTFELKIIKQNIDKLLNDMVNFFDILKFEKGLNIYFHDTPINLSDFVNNKIELFKPIIKKHGLNLTFEIEDNMFIMMDPSAIDRVINNLIDNAIKYNKPSGSINIILKLEDDKIKLIINDTGIGIAEDQLDKIFMPYYQISHKKSNVQGIGMGLSIVKNIIYDTKGEINIKSIPGEGSSFVITFNGLKKNADDIIYEKPDESYPVISFPVYEDPCKDENISIEHECNILVVEDNRELLLLIKEKMKQYYNIYCSLNGKDALIKLEIIPVPDVIVSDIMMDEMDGYELFNNISAMDGYEDIPFIFITAKSSIEEKLKGLKTGAIDFIFKPFVIDELIAKIESILRYMALKKENFEKDKFATLGMLVGGISHEIFNPLSGITGPLENLKKIINSSNIKDNIKVIKYFKYIENSVNKIENIINNLRLLYYKKELKKDKLNILEIIHSVIEIYKTRTDKKINFNLKINQSLDIRGDKEAMYHVLRNLVSNAFDSIKTEGDITIFFGFDNGEKTLKVIDNGEGIKMQDRENLFTPFYTTKNAGSGMGLGLYIVKNIIYKMGYDIKFNSIENKETCFMIIVKD